MENIIIRFSEKKDNNQIIEILKKEAVSGSISYITDRSPDYFEYLELTGYDYKVIVAEIDNQIVGFVCISFSKVFLNKKVENMAYTWELRLDSNFRKKGIADKLMNFAIKTCYDVLGEDAKIFTCVIGSNKDGLRKNEKLYKSGLVNIKKAGEINTYFILPFNLKKEKGSKYFIREFKEEDLDEMYILWCNTQINKNLGRYFRKEEFFEWIKNIKKNHDSSYIVVFDNNKMIAFCGLWNFNKLKKIILSDEKKYFKIIRFFWFFISKILNISRFPKKGESLNFFSLINLCVDNNSKDVLKEIILFFFKYTKEHKGIFLALALDKKDPLNNELKNFIFDKSELFFLNNYESDNINHFELSLG
jgi:GNAT superfamily N-acetyltransferase